MNQSGTKVEPSVKPKWNQSGTKVEPKWNQSGTKVWNQSGTKVEPRVSRLYHDDGRTRHDYVPPREFVEHVPLPPVPPVPPSFLVSCVGRAFPVSTSPPVPVAPSPPLRRLPPAGDVLPSSCVGSFPLTEAVPAQRLAPGWYREQRHIEGISTKNDGNGDGWRWMEMDGDECR